MKNKVSLKTTFLLIIGYYYSLLFLLAVLYKGVCFFLNTPLIQNVKMSLVESIKNWLTPEVITVLIVISPLFIFGIPIVANALFTPGKKTKPTEKADNDNFWRLLLLGIFFGR